MTPTLPQGALTPDALLKVLLAVARTHGDSGKSPASSHRELHWGGPGGPGESQAMAHRRSPRLAQGQKPLLLGTHSGSSPSNQGRLPTGIATLPAWPAPLRVTPTLPPTTMGAFHPSEDPKSLRLGSQPRVCPISMPKRWSLTIRHLGTRSSPACAPATPLRSADPHCRDRKQGDNGAPCQGSLTKKIFPPTLSRTPHNTLEPLGGGKGEGYQRSNPTGRTPAPTPHKPRPGAQGPCSLAAGPSQKFPHL